MARTVTVRVMEPVTIKIKRESLKYILKLKSLTNIQMLCI
jgi:hypothetical protein